MAGKGAPLVGVRAASFTVALDVGLAVLPSSSVTVRETVLEPSSAYGCVPLTVNVPALRVTVPVLVPVSPHAMLAVKSAVVANELASVNVATAPLKDDPSVAETLTPDAVSAPSATLNAALVPGGQAC